MLTLDIAQELYFTPEERGSHILNTNQAGVDIYRMRRKDGSTIWVEDHGYYIHDKQGNILYHEGILRDISARKQAEDETSQRLMELETLYESGLTINQLPDPQQIGQKVIDLLKQKLGWSQANIRLYHPQKENQEQPEIENDTALEAPMRYGGEWIGALALTADKTNPAERAFTEADKRLLSLFASQAAGAIHSARLRKQTARQLDQLQALHLIDRAISSSFDLRTILNTVISQTITQLKVDAANILLYHPSLQTLDYIAGQGFNSHNIEKTHLRLGECLAGQAAFERRTTHSHNLPQDGSKFRRTALLEGEKFLEYYAVPLIAKGEVKGVLEVFNRTPLPMDAEWLDFLETLAGQAAIAINQTHLFEDLQRANFELIAAYDATIEGWARAMDLRDRETENHTRRVTEMSVTLAKAMGIKDSELISIRRGALLHDIGKIGVPDNILLKEGALNAKEWEIMRQHPQFAYEMIKPIKYLRQSLDIPYCHHEKWDGTGYPRGLKGEQIPLAARIFAVVDVWDAVTIDRPYRAGWTKESAIQYIREQSAKHFDPRVVEVFLKIIA
jgi:HD-GYP domain-containing protein (c-di-GMP phosphodiesterase class II)